MYTPALRQTWPWLRPTAAICVQGVDDHCALQVTLSIGASSALHRRASRTIHRLVLSEFIVPRARRSMSRLRDSGEPRRGAIPTGARPPASNAFHRTTASNRGASTTTTTFPSTPSPPARGGREGEGVVALQLCGAASGALGVPLSYAAFLWFRLLCVAAPHLGCWDSPERTVHHPFRARVTASPPSSSTRGDTPPAL